MTTNLNQIPDGRAIGPVVSARIANEKAKAAIELANQLVAHYIKQNGSSKTLRLYRTTIQFSELAIKYGAHLDVLQEVGRILAERNWSVAFDKGEFYQYCDLTPLG